MKCQNLFPRKNKKKCINLSSDELAQRMVKVKLRWLQLNNPKCENISKHVVRFGELFIDRQPIRIQLHKQFGAGSIYPIFNV